MISTTTSGMYVSMTSIKSWVKTQVKRIFFKSKSDEEKLVREIIRLVTELTKDDVVSQECVYHILVGTNIPYADDLRETSLLLGNIFSNDSKNSSLSSKVEYSLRCLERDVSPKNYAQLIRHLHLTLVYELYADTLSGIQFILKNNEGFEKNINFEISLVTKLFQYVHRIPLWYELYTILVHRLHTYFGQFEHQDQRYNLIFKLSFYLERIQYTEEDVLLRELLRWCIDESIAVAGYRDVPYLYCTTLFRAEKYGFEDLAEKTFQKIVSVMSDFQGDNIKYLIGIETERAFYGLGMLNYATNKSTAWGKRVVEYSCELLEKTDWPITTYFKISDRAKIPNWFLAEKLGKHLCQLPDRSFEKIDAEIDAISKSRKNLCSMHLYYILLCYTKDTELLEYALRAYKRWCEQLSISRLYAEFTYDEFPKLQSARRCAKKEIIATCFEKGCLSFWEKPKEPEVVYFRYHKNQVVVLPDSTAEHDPDRLWISANAALKLLQYGQSMKYLKYLRSFL